MCATLAGEAISSEANGLRSLTHSFFESLRSTATKDVLVLRIASFKPELWCLERCKSVFRHDTPVFVERERHSEGRVSSIGAVGLQV